LGGPEATGASPETGLAHSWPPEGPATLWTVDVGEGFAGPAARDGQVFFLDRIRDEQDVLRCLDLATGRELWRLGYDAPGSLPHNGSRNVPTVDEQYIFTVGPFGQFRCVDRATHQLLWAAHLVDDFKDPQTDTGKSAETREEKLARAQLPMWGMTQAPCLYKDLVVVAPQTQSTGLVAYEKKTGKIQWRSGYIGRNWYSHVSPCLTTLAGVQQIIMLAQPSDPEKSPRDAPPAIISSIDPDNGRILWKTQTPGPYKIPITEPLRVADDRLFITGGYTLGCLMLQVRRVGGEWEPTLIFHRKTVAAFLHSPILYHDRIFVTSFKDQGGSHSGLVCLSTEGEPLWETGPALQFESGASLIADGLAFVMHGRTGQLYLFELSDSGPKLVAQAKVLDARGGDAWAPMALSDGKLLVRDQHQMKCLEVRLAKPARAGS
jgi:outer membrane protein assembly factor BamB